MTSQNELSPANCPDPFHEGLTDGGPYVLPSDGSGWVMGGYRCPTCGFETVTVSHYQPVDRSCRDCGASFGADSEDPNDTRCADCFGVHARKTIDAMIASGELKVGD